MKGLERMIHDDSNGLDYILLFDYLTDTSNKCSDLNEFYYRMGLRDGLKLREAMHAMLDALTE